MSKKTILQIFILQRKLCNVSIEEFNANLRKKIYKMFKEFLILTIPRNKLNIIKTIHVMSCIGHKLLVLIIIQIALIRYLLLMHRYIPPHSIKLLLLSSRRNQFTLIITARAR